MIGETEEAWLGIIEGVLIVHADIVLATLVRANRDALLGQAHILLNVPDLKDPILVECVNAARGLIANHVNNVVMLEGWSGTQVHRRERSISGDVILVQLVL